VVIIGVISSSNSLIRSKTQDANNLVNWSGSSLPGQLVSSADENDRIAARDIPVSPLSPDDFRSAETIVEDDFDFVSDPIETAGLFEGDIADVTMDDLRKLRSGDYSKNAIRELWKKWPDATIPYEISSQFGSYERSVVAKAMKTYHKKTCIKFIPRTTEGAYTYLMKGSGCSSSIGRTGSRQTVSLGLGCVYSGIIMHELMHAAGFWHEQSRADRDDYISINWSNIRAGMEFNFLKYDLRKIDHLGAEYDTCSVMHYGAYAFAKNSGVPTIVAKKKTKCKLGQRKGFSDTDIRKLNTLYKCKGYPQTGNSLIKPDKPKPSRPTGSKPSCTDVNRYCATWSKLGECDRNPRWMLSQCPVACDQCAVKCDNNNVWCETWAEQGECRNNPEYMDIYCTKACKQCNTKRNCRDNKKDCAAWGKKGFCSSGLYVNYMKQNCKKSCNLC